MAQDTFQVLYKGLLLRCPSLPLSLAQVYIKHAYRRVLDRNEWGATRANTEWTTPDEYSTGTVSLTQGSATVTGSSTVWTSSMVGRQFKVGSGPFYTIATFNSSTSIDLDRVYGGLTESGVTYTISQAYYTVPSDFKELVSVWDPTNSWRLRKGYSQEYLDGKDPQRSYTGSPKIVASAYYTTGTSPVPRFEVWPRPTSAGYLAVRYYKELADLSADADKLIYPINGDLILSGALADLSLHPGTAEAPNPYFNIDLADKFRSEFELGLRDAIKQDQAIYLTDFWRAEDNMPYAPLMDTAYLVDHDPYFYPY